MPIYESCKCLPSSLKKILDNAISNLESISVGTRTDDYEKIKHDLEKHLEALKDMGIPSTQIEIIRQSIPRDPIVKQFSDLKAWSSQCECPPGIEFDWTQFPYHEIGYKEPVVRTGVAGEACTISKTEKQELDTKLTELANKYVYSVRDPVFLVFMKDKYGEKEITASNVRKEAVKRGLMSESEMNEFNRIASELDKACGRQSGKTRNIHDTRLLKERHEAGLLTEKREKYFEKRR